MNKDFKYILMIIISVICLSVGLLMFNVKSSKNVKVTSTTTTTKIVVEENLKKDKIIVNGVEEEIVLKTYVAYDIFKIDIDVTNFEMMKLSNNTYYLKDLNDENIYLKFEMIDEETFNRENISNNVNYTYLHGDKIYLKVTKNVDECISDTILKRMDYMLATLYIS
ncbi:unknown [Firmicutes bacterium CAG:582]|nr:unknown [Firmicutes bacterium CAG:582]